MTNNCLQSLAQTSLSDIFEAAASINPTPGGGCVSAIGGYLGVSLLLKAIRISARKRPNDMVFKEVEQQLLALAPKLLHSAQADSDAFRLYIQALQRPKDSEEQKTSRTIALRQASIAATEVALDILDLGNVVLQCSLQVRDKVLPTILADVYGGIELASAMNTVALENAKVNLSGLVSADALRNRFEAAIEQHHTLRASIKGSE